MKTSASRDDSLQADRRRFLGTAAVTSLSLVGMTMAQAADPTAAIQRGPLASFGPLKQINAGDLNVAYAEAGPANGPAVLLLHGWPYDIHTYVDVAPLLAARGYRVIVPYLRGYGATRFLSKPGAST